MIAQILVHPGREAMAEQSRTVLIMAARNEREGEGNRETEWENILSELVVVFLVNSTMCLVNWMVPPPSRPCLPLCVDPLWKHVHNTHSEMCFTNPMYISIQSN